MGTIQEELGSSFGWKNHSGIFAVEIETETESEADYSGVGFTLEETSGGKIKLPMTTWEGHHDGSLRNFGVEFVSKKPLPLEGIMISLDEFKEKTKDVKFLKDAPATSVHVHLNILPLTLTQLGNFLTAWMLLENILTEFSGESRRSNLFALPNRCAEGCCKNIVSMFSQLQSGNPFGLKWQQDYVKYAALNIGRIGTLGSLEVRCFRGTTDVNEIKEWITILNDIYVFSKTDGMNPRNIVTRYRTDPLDFFYEVFPNGWTYLKRVLESENIIQYMNRNLWYAVMIADSVLSWEKLDTKFSEKIRNKYKKVSTKAPVIEHYMDENGNVSWEMFNAAMASYNATNAPAAVIDPQPIWTFVEEDEDDDYPGSEEED